MSEKHNGCNVLAALCVCVCTGLSISSETWVLFAHYCDIAVCLTLFGQVEIWQDLHGSAAIMVEYPNLNQHNIISERMDNTVHGPRGR